MEKEERTPIQELPYSAGLMSQSCWFIEFKKIIQLIASGKSEDEIKTECLENNLLGAVKEYRAKRVYGYLIARSKMLDAEGVKLFMDSDLATQKLINLVAILRGDRLFFEFVYEVYREKVILGQPELEDRDFSIFFRNKGEQSELVESWNDSTKRHLKSNYVTCMTDANLLHTEGRKRLITKPIVDNSLIWYLKDSRDEAILTAISGVV